MNLAKALQILQFEFPDQYTHVYVEIKQHRQADPPVINWKVYVGGNKEYPNEMSDSCANLDDAIKNLKQKLNINQPIPEDVEVTA
jgi:hypothetical protein